MQPTSTRAAIAYSESAIVSTLVTAFSSDPAARWAYPDPHQYLENFPAFVRAFGGKAFEHGTAYVAPGCAGVALWLLPDVHPDDNVLVPLIERTVAPAILGDAFSVFEQMGAFHPAEPHWYLPMLGVDPHLQGRGYGSALLRESLAVCDREGTLAYLESSNPRNIPLYERHGFQVIGTIQKGSSPEIYPMLRIPQR